MEENQTNTIEKLTFKEKVTYFFKSPTKLYESTATEKPKIWALLLFLCLCTLINALAFSSTSKTVRDELIKKSTKGMDIKTAEITKNIMTKVMSPTYHCISSLVGVIIGTFFIAFLIFILFKICKTHINYKQTVFICLVSSVATSIGLVFKAIYMFISKKPVGVEPIINPSVKSALMSSLDIFSIWYYVILGIGIYTVGKTSKKKATIITIILAIITVGFAILSVKSKMH